MENSQLTASYRGCKKTWTLEEKSLTMESFLINMSPIKNFLSINHNFSETIVQTDSIDDFINLTCVPENDYGKSLEGVETLGILNLESLS
jgi:hypothetical protein